MSDHGGPSLHAYATAIKIIAAMHDFNLATNFSSAFTRETSLHQGRGMT